MIAGVEHKEAHDDVIVWSFPAAADPSILRWDGQDPVETRDEAANAVFVDGERILVAGTAEIQDGNNAVRPRMFVLEYQSSALTRWWGHLVGDEFLALQSEARGVSGDGHGGAVVVGTARPTPVSPAFTQVLRLDPETLEAEPQPFNDEIEGVAVGAALDPTGRVVVALENGSHAPATIDVAALHPAAASVGWQAGWEPPAGAALARGLAVDRHGFVFWIGDAYDNGVHVLVGKRHP